jgi:hypothetical protein
MGQTPNAVKGKRGRERRRRRRRRREEGSGRRLEKTA